jgi:hypothetical protein
MNSHLAHLQRLADYILVVICLGIIGAIALAQNQGHLTQPPCAAHRSLGQYQISEDVQTSGKGHADQVAIAPGD